MLTVLQSVAIITGLNLSANAITRYFEGLGLIFDQYSGFINVQDDCRAPPTGVTLPMWSFVKEYSVPNFEIRAVKGLVMS